jgi:hypothetical protein
MLAIFCTRSNAAERKYVLEKDAICAAILLGKTADEGKQCRLAEVTLFI